MKRTGAPAGGSGGPKRSRGPGGYDEEGGGGSQTFEEELMMMDDENMGDERIDMDDQDDPMVQVKRWSRPAADAGFDPKQHSLAFHWVDIDVTSGPPLAKNPCEGERTIGSKEPVVPIIRLYGSTKDGNSVLTYVHGFTSYFYVALPPSTNLSDNSRAKIRAYLDQKVSSSPIFFLVLLPSLLLRNLAESNLLLFLSSLSSITPPRRITLRVTCVDERPRQRG